MNSLRHIPLHILMLAGLTGPLSAQERNAPAPSAAPAAKSASLSYAYAGLNVAALNDEAKTKAGVSIPEGVGLRVVVVDPQGPSAGKVEVGDVLTRLDDQVLVSSEQFRTLVRLRKAGEKLKLVAVREGEVKTLEVELAAKSAPERARVAGAAPAPGAAAGLGSPLSITVNGQQLDLGGMPGLGGTMTQVGPGHVVIIGPNQGLPPEVKKQLEEMRARGLPIPPIELPGVTALDPNPAQAQADAQAGATVRRESKSFSFSFGGPGATTTSSSVASDEHGTVSVEQKDGKKHAVIKDKDGNVTFDGDVTSEEARAKMPAEARDRLKLVEGSSFSIQGLKPGRKADGAVAPEPPKRKRDPKEGA